MQATRYKILSFIPFSTHSKSIQWNLRIKDSHFYYCYGNLSLIFWEIINCEDVLFSEGPLSEVPQYWKVVYMKKIYVVPFVSNTGGDILCYKCYNMGVSYM